MCHAEKNQQQIVEDIATAVDDVEGSPKGGRPRVDARGALNGILFVLRTAIPWEDWPQELGWQRHDLLASAGRLEGQRRWERLHLALLTRLRGHRPVLFDGVVNAALLLWCSGCRHRARMPCQ